MSKLQLSCLLLLIALLMPIPGIVRETAGDAGPRLEIDLDPAGHRLTGTLQLSAAGAVLPGEIIRLSPRADILEVSLHGTPQAYRFDAGVLTLAPGSGPASGDLVVRYRLVFADRPPANPAHAEDPSYGVSASIQPEGTYLGSGTGWYPQLAGQAGFVLQVRAPEGYRAVTSGRFLEALDEGGTSLTRWATSGHEAGLTLAAGPYLIRKELGGTVPIYAFFGAETIDLADSYLATAREYLELYQRLFGPYPFPQFVIAANFFPTGYGFPGWTLLGSSVIRLPFIVSSSLVHEIAHCWWGNGVRPDRRQGNWSEGLATYLADHLVKERSSPEEARDYRLKLLRDYATLSTEGGPLSGFQSRFDRRSQVIGYGKGAMVFHMIRRQIGDEGFWAGLRTAAERYLFRTASWDDLLQCFAEQGHPEILEQFRPWLTRSDIPALSFDRVEVRKVDDRWTVSGRVAQHGKPWPLRLELVLRSAEDVQHQVLRLTDALTPFSISSGQQPLALQADPETDLMRQLDPVEIPATVNHLRSAAPLTVYSCAVAAPLDPRPLQTLLAALRQPGDAVQTVSRLPRPLPDGSLLVYGHGCLDGLPVEENGEARRVLAGLPQAPADRSVLAVVKRRDQPAAVAAVFQPAAGEDAITVARKIPHYGKYSALEFSGSSNVRKQTWQAEATPLLLPLTGNGDPQP